MMAPMVTLFPVDLQRDFGVRIVASARRQLAAPAAYSPGYARIRFPNGDIDARKGVCTDVVIRALRPLGLDLQGEIFRDAGKFQKAYPRIHGRDPNIDHRRVPNQATYIMRHGWKLANDRDFQPGDFVWWKLKSGLDHIGIVTDSIGRSGRPTVIHNIRQTAEEDVLMKWAIIGHYRLKRR